MTASTRLISVSIERLSRTNRTSPCLTRAPSSNLTAMISLSMRGLIATLAMVVTVPSASSRTGTDFLTALAAVTPTTRWSPRGACAAAFCDDDPFQKKHGYSGKGEPRSRPYNHRSFLHVALSARLETGVPHSLIPPWRLRTRLPQFYRVM